MSYLALRNVSKRFGTTMVLDDLSLQTAANEFVVVLGPSGCGKSTLLRSIAGLETIDSGDISLGGRRIDTLPPGKRGVAMVFQSYALYPHMSVRENMAFGLRNVGVSGTEIARRIGEAARVLEMEKLLERKPAELSGGQRQRAAIGRAIVKEPALFMFDEPLSNLDAALRTRTRQEIAALHRRIQAAMIFVTHDQTEAMTLADRIVVMNNCRIEQVGTPLEIYSRPATLFVAGFVGSPAINVLAADRIGDGTLQAIRVADGAEIATRVRRVPGEGPLRAGFRAEAIRLCAPDQAATKGVIDFVEYLGDRTLVHVALASGSRIVANGDASFRLRTGEAAGLIFDGAAAHLFDEDGRGHHAV